MAEKSIQALYLSYDGMTDPLGQSQVIPYILGLSRRNIRFTIISFEKPDAFSKTGDAIRQLLERNQVRWIPLKYTKHPPVASSVFDLWSLKRTVRKLWKEQPFDIIHCRSYIAALAGLWAKRKWGAKFIFDMRGLWADERVDGGLWNLKNPVYKLVYAYFKKKELEFLLHADHTISLTKAAKEEILSWSALQGQTVPIDVIPCCVDMDLFDPDKIPAENLQAWRKKLDITPSAYVLSYVGSIGTWYMLDEMLLFFKKLRERLPEAVFLFITRDEHARIRDRAESLGIGHAIRLQSAARPEVPELLALSQMSIFFILPAYSKKASSPTKQGEIMAMGLPAICNAGVGDTDDIIRRYQSGYVLEAGRMDACIDSIVRRVPHFSPADIRQGARDYFSLEAGIEKYAVIYQQMF